MSFWSTKKDLIVALILGQAVSLLITGTGVTSTALATTYQVNMPSTQSFLNYFLLLLYLIPLIRRLSWPSFKDVVKAKWWVYLGLAVCDVEANFLVVLAYQYTSLASVMLLDCFSIPIVMLLGRFFLNRRFGLFQFLGVAMCLGGVIALVIVDWDQSSASHAVLGDVLCLAGAVLYAISNTGQEVVVVHHSKFEYLALLGLFATPISAAQSATIEHKAWVDTTWSWPVIGLLLAFAACLFCIYALVPLVLERAGSTFLNLSLLTADLYSMVAGIFLFDQVPTLWYLIPAVLIVAGLIVYNINVELKPKPEYDTLKPELEVQASDESTPIAPAAASYQSDSKNYPDS